MRTFAATLIALCIGAAGAQALAQDHGHMRPPIGLVVTDLPEYRTVVAIGGVSYLYANGVYYREAGGGYEVMPSTIVGAPDGSTTRTYVYPKLNQSAERQASDEYECHRWAV